MLRKRNSSTCLMVLNTLSKRVFSYVYEKSNNRALWVTAVATFVLAATAFYPVIISIKTYKNQLEYYKNITRPFLVIESVDILHTNKESDQDSIEVEITIKNDGNLPAKSIYVFSPFEAKPDTNLLKATDIEPTNDIKTFSGLYPEKIKKIYYYGILWPSFQPKKIFLDRIMPAPFYKVIVFYKDMDGEEYYYMEIFVLDRKKLEFMKNTTWINFN